MLKFVECLDYIVTNPPKKLQAPYSRLKFEEFCKCHREANRQREIAIELIDSPNVRIDIEKLADWELLINKARHALKYRGIGLSLLNWTPCKNQQRDLVSPYFSSFVAEIALDDIAKLADALKRFRSADEKQAFPPRPKGKRSRHRIDSKYATEVDKAIHSWEIKLVRMAGKGGAQTAWNKHKHALVEVLLDYAEFKKIYNRHRKAVFQN